MWNETRSSTWILIPSSSAAFDKNFEATWNGTSKIRRVAQHLTNTNLDFVGKGRVGGVRYRNKWHGCHMGNRMQACERNKAEQLTNWCEGSTKEKAKNEPKNVTEHCQESTQRVLDPKGCVGAKSWEGFSICAPATPAQCIPSEHASNFERPSSLHNKRAKLVCHAACVCMFGSFWELLSFPWIPGLKLEAAGLPQMWQPRKTVTRGYP